MLDIRLIREQPEFVRKKLETRGAGDEKILDSVLTLDQEIRGHVKELQALREQRNRISKEVAELLAQGKPAEADEKKKWRNSPSIIQQHG